MINSLLILAEGLALLLVFSPIKSTKHPDSGSSIPMRSQLVYPNWYIPVVSYQYSSYMFMYNNIYIYIPISYSLISQYIPLYHHEIHFHWGLYTSSDSAWGFSDRKLYTSRSTWYTTPPWWASPTPWWTNTIYSQNISPLGQLGGAVAVT